MADFANDVTDTAKFLLSLGGMFLLLALIGGSTYHILCTLCR